MKGKYSALTVAKWFLWYNDWMEIKFKIDKYFSDQLSKYEKQLKLDSQYTNSHY